MKRFFILAVIACFLSTCQGQSFSPKQSPRLQEPNNLEDIIRNLEILTQKKAQQNSVIRYQQDDKEARVYSPYDSLVSGYKIKFVDEVTAYRIIDLYFSKVKKFDQYLYLTHLDFDKAYNSHYDVVIAPLANQSELIRWVGTEPVNYGLSTQDVVDWFTQQEKTFDFEIIVADLDRIEARIRTEPNSYQQLGENIYQFCPDVIDQGHGDMDELVDFLKTEKRMWFWWD